MEYVKEIKESTHQVLNDQTSVCVCVWGMCISACASMCMCLGRLEADLSCHLSGADHFVFLRQGFPLVSLIGQYYGPGIIVPGTGIVNVYYHDWLFKYGLWELN